MPNPTVKSSWEPIITCVTPLHIANYMIFGRLRSVQCLCQMRGVYLLTPCQVSNRARQLQDAMIARADNWYHFSHYGKSDILVQ